MAKTILITGATGGLGRALARNLAGRGHCCSTAAVSSALTTWQKHSR